MATVRAEHNAKFYRRFLLIGIGALIFMGFCLRDGLLVYPAEKKYFNEYEVLQQEGRAEEWGELAAEKGWPTTPPKKRTTVDIWMQYAMAAVTGLLGLGMLLKVFMARGTWIESDGAGVTTSWGQSFKYGDIIQVDKRKWQNKGIANITYRDGEQTKKFVLDDFKFHREPTDQILLDLESKIDSEKITGGPTEAEVLTAQQAQATLAQETTESAPQ